MNGAGSQVGSDVRVEAVVHLDSLEPSDIQVDLYYGSLDEDGQLTDGETMAMEQIDDATDQRVRYVVDMPCRRSGMTGYTVRVLPRHDLLTNPIELGMIRWA